MIARLNLVRKQIELVQASIDRVKAARVRHLEAQADPTSDADDRGAAKDALLSAEREFGWQWENVDTILRRIEELSA